MKIAVIYVQYDTKKYPHSLPYIVGQLNKTNLHTEYVIVDNLRKEKEEEVFGVFHIIAGNNKNWEFSGWQKGLDYVKKNISHDVILFVNDSLKSYGKTLLDDDKLKDMFYLSKKHNLLIGRIDRSLISSELFFNERDLSSWICSNCFIGSSEIFQLLNVDNTDLFNVNEITQDLKLFMSSKEISSGLKRHIYLWLSKYWHSAFNAESDGILFKNKAKAIINEMLLTNRAMELGFRVFDSKSKCIHD